MDIFLLFNVLLVDMKNPSSNEIILSKNFLPSFWTNLNASAIYGAWVNFWECKIWEIFPKLITCQFPVFFPNIFDKVTFMKST